jgi:signal transduction histidine kinase
VIVAGSVTLVDRARTRADGGSGIGLTIARAIAIVEAHGGHIRAESDGPGRGSRFVIGVPVMTGQLGSADGGSLCSAPGTA